jgi:hypothetical protein
MPHLWIHFIPFLDEFATSQFCYKCDIEIPKNYHAMQNSAIESHREIEEW